MLKRNASTRSKNILSKNLGEINKTAFSQSQISFRSKTKEKLKDVKIPLPNQKIEVNMPRRAKSTTKLVGSTRGGKRQMSRPR